MQLYESLSEDEWDMHDKGEHITEPSQPTDPTTEGSVKPEKTMQGL